MPKIINNFQKGIAKSPLFGFQEMRGLNITDKPGLVYPNKALTKESSTTIKDLPERFVKTSEGEVWGYTSDNLNDVYKRATNGTWSELTNHTDAGLYGISFWKSYVGVLYQQTIDWYDISDDSCDTSWGNDITSCGAAIYRAWCHAQDDYLYIAGLNVIDKIVEDTNFVPGTGASYTITKAALTLPEDYIITSMVELGDKMLIGCYKSNDALSADIFVWDRVSTAVDRIIPINDNGVRDMITIDNKTYVRAGLKGRWYVTDGTNVDVLGFIPTSTLDLTSINLVDKGQSFSMGDLIYFGVSYNSALEGLGLYSINIHTGVVNFEHIISKDEYGQNDGVYIGGGMGIGGTTSNFVIAWADLNGTDTWGVDDIGSTGYTSDRSFLISQWYQLGFDGSKEALTRPVLKLSKPLASGDSVEVQYREALNGSWTSHYSTAVVGFQEEIMPGIKDIQNIQFKVILNLAAELEAIILI